MIAALPQRGLIGLGYWGLGFRNVTNSKHPIAKLEDFGGLKLRVIPNPVYLESFSAFKANPVPMAFGELYSALETRTVDGQENPYTVILSNKFYEVQKYVSATNHTYTQNIILVSKIFWDKLSPAEQKMMQEAYDESRDYQADQTRLQTEKALSELQAKGMQYNAVPPEELERMRKAAQPVVDKISASPSPGDREDLQRRTRSHPQGSEVRRVTSPRLRGEVDAHRQMRVRVRGTLRELRRGESPSPEAFAALRLRPLPLAGRGEHPELRPHHGTNPRPVLRLP